MTLNIHRGVFWPVFRYVTVSYLTALSLLVWFGFVIYTGGGIAQLLSNAHRGVIWLMHSNFFILYGGGFLLQSYEFLGMDYLGFFLPKPVSRDRYLISVVVANLSAAAVVNLISYIPLLFFAPLDSAEFWTSLLSLSFTEIFLFAPTLTLSVLLTLIFRSRYISQMVPVILFVIWMGSGQLIRLMETPDIVPNWQLFGISIGVAIATYGLADALFARRNLA